MVFLSTPEGKRWIYSFGFVDVYWLFSCLQQSEQRKEVSLTLLLPAQITLSQVGAKWKLNRFFFLKKNNISPIHITALLKRSRNWVVSLREKCCGVPRQTKMRNESKNEHFSILTFCDYMGYPGFHSLSNEALMIIVPRDDDLFSFSTVRREIPATSTLH